MTTLFMFPGQGGQQPGLLQRLPEHAEVHRTRASASDVLQIDLANLDTPDALKSTRCVQLCLLIAGVAMARLLIHEGAMPDAVTGLSIGAFPAAVTAGVISFEVALRCVDLRGRLMETAFPQGYGMTAIMGLDADTLGSLIAQTHSPQQPVYLANVNAPDQLVISGHDQAMHAVATRALTQGATRVQRLNVTVPSHCPLFDQAAGQLQQWLTAQAAQRPRFRYLSSTQARQLIEPKAILDDLASNVARPVRWYETARLAWEYGVRLAIEMPGGSALTGLTTPHMTDGQVVSCDNLPAPELITLIQRSR